MPLQQKQIVQVKRGAFIGESEMERLRRDVYRSDKDKLLLFTKMLRNNQLLKSIKITHK